MNRPALLRVDRTFVVDGLPEDVEYPPESLLADGNGDRLTEVDGLHATDHAVGRLHCDAAHLVLADVVGHLSDNIDWDLPELAVVENADGVVDRGKVSFLEFDIECGADDLNHFSCFLLSHELAF